MPIEEASREKVYAAEKGLAGIRVAIIALNSVVYHFLLPKEGTVTWLAYAIIVAANAYGLLVLLARPYERYPVMMSSLFTSALDATFITLWLHATGGYESPFHLLWLVSVTAVAFRYGPRETLFAAILYALCYVGLLAVDGGLGAHPGEVALRLAYIGFVAAVGSLFAREARSQTRAKVELREVAARLREAEARFRTLSDAALEGIAIHEHGKVIECNRAFARLFGYDREEEVVGKSAFDLIAPESHAEIAQRVRAASDEPYEVIGRRRDAGRFDLELAGRDLPYGGRTVRVIAARDVTARKAAERAAREREELEATNKRLRELDRMKTQLINNAAHELGTPLTPIKIQAHLLRTGSAGPLSERQAKAVDILSRNVDHLARLVGDILDVSKLQAGKLRVEPCDADAGVLLQEAVESFSAAAHGQGVQLDLEAAPKLPARIDPARVTQVVFNLIHNALKFTPAGGRVLVRAEERADGILVEVRDTGAGIARADLEKLFQPFSQVHDKMQRTKSGTGLGLYVCRGIVEQHGGRIGVESDGPGKGARFWFTLPR